jgi:hypothetical protein
MTIKDLLTRGFVIRRMSGEPDVFTLRSFPRLNRLEPGQEWYQLSFEIAGRDSNELLDILIALRKEAGLPPSLWQMKTQNENNDR